MHYSAIVKEMLVRSQAETLTEEERGSIGRAEVECPCILFWFWYLFNILETIYSTIP